MENDCYTRKVCPAAEAMSSLSLLQLAHERERISEIAVTKTAPQEQAQVLDKAQALEIFENGLNGQIDSRFFEAAQVVAKECLNGPDSAKLRKQLESREIKFTIDANGVTFRKSQPWGFWGTNTFVLDIPFGSSKAPSGQFIQQYDGQPPEEPNQIDAKRAAHGIFDPVYLPLPF